LEKSCSECEVLFFLAEVGKMLLNEAVLREKGLDIFDTLDAMTGNSGVDIGGRECGADSHDLVYDFAGNGEVTVVVFE
jgi:hypothetical protein